MLKLLKYLKPYRKQVAVTLTLLFMQSLAELYLPTLMAGIVNTGIIKGDTAYILRIGCLMLLVAGVGAACSVSAGYLSSKTSMGFGKTLRGEVFRRVESYSLHEFDKIGTASLITRNTNDVTQLQNVVNMMMRMMVSAPLMCIGGIIMAVSKDPELSLVLLVALPLLVGAVIGIAGKGVRLFKTMQEKIDRLNLVLRESLTGVRVIRAFNRIEDEAARFDAANAELTGTAIKVNRIMAVLMPVMMLVMNFTSIAIIWFGGIRISNGEMNVGDMMAFLQYSMLILLSLVMVSMMFVVIPRAEASAVRINEVLEMEPEITDPAQPMKPGAKKGYVEFRDVTFSYPGAEEPALSGISFCTGPGEVTAIIGGTGSGKTTLVNLIPRFYDVDSGSILVDGIEIDKLSQEELRSKIGYVPQKASLFTGTINENIRFGKNDAAPGEIMKAADTAQASEFVTGMKDSFDSVISQGGTNVSGGQKQRLSIARALIREPEIYIFDDSFSALDFRTDAKLRAALRKETAEATVLIVAQRVNTVMDADRIIVLEDGKIAAIGNHRELLKSCEVYKEIVASQLSEEEIA